MQRKTTLSREFSEEGPSCHWEILKIITHNSLFGFIWFCVIEKNEGKSESYPLATTCKLTPKKIITMIIIVIKLLGGKKNDLQLFSQNNSTRRKKYFSKYIEMRWSYPLWEWSRTKFLFGHEFGLKWISICDLYIDFKVSLTHHVSFLVGTLDSHTRLHLVRDWIMLHT